MRPSCAGVEGEDLNLTPESAYFMGQAFTDMLEQQLGKHSHQLRISVRRLLMTSSQLHADSCSVAAPACT